MTVESTATVRYRVLGPLEVTGADGTVLELRGQKMRALVCALLLSPGHTVSLDRIITALWGDEPPAAATATLQAYISQLRRLLEPERGPRQAPTRLVTRAPGYALLVESGALDTDELESLVIQGEDAMAAGRFAVAEDRFSAALALRRGTPFADVADEPFAIGVIARLEQLLLVASERRIDALLSLGRVGAAAADLELLVAEHPLRERLWAQLIEALARNDRQADALRAYQTCRAVLIEELGVEPGATLREMERRILAQEPLDIAVSSAPSGADAPSRTVESVTGAHDSVILDPGPSGGMVGRREELEVLDRALDHAVGGSGSIVSIEGESGIGKSRLAEEATRRAAARGFATAWTTCADEVGAPALWPWEDALLALGQDPPPLHHDPDPDTERFQRVLAVLDTLVSASRRTPLMVVIDDLQWADAASLQAVSVLSSRCQSARLVVVVTVRRPDVRDHRAVHDLLADVSRQRNVHRLRLSGLAEPEVASLIDDLAGRRVDATLVETVTSRTGGNPFFVSEMVRLLSSEQALTSTPSESILQSVPDNVREVVERRLDRLPEDTRTLLRLASVAGPVIDLEVFEHATSLPGERIIVLLEAAVVAGMLAELETHVGWRFTHALVQDAVRATLGRAQRAGLHATLVDAIEQVYRHDLRAHLDELAHHSVEAAALGRADAAVRWCTEAALDARANGRFDRAVRYWRSALSVLHGASTLPTTRFDLSLMLAHDLRASGDTDGFALAVAQAIDLAGQLEDRHRMALAAAELGWVNLWNTRGYGAIDSSVCGEIEQLAEEEGDARLAAQLFGAVAVELYYGERRAHGEALARRAVTTARDLGDPVLLGRTLNNFVLAAWVPGRDSERLAACNESLALVGHGLPAQTEVVARLHRAALRLRAGEIELVEEDLTQCRELATEIAIPEITAQLMYAECGLGLLRAQWDDAERLAEDAYEIHARTKLWGADWCRVLQLVCIRGAQGRVGEVAELAVRLAYDASLIPMRATAVMAVAQAGDLVESRRLAQRWDWRSETPDWSWDHRLADWAEAAALTGSDDVAELYEALLPHADTVRVSGTAIVCRGSMHGVLARLARRLADPGAARRHRDAAVRANRRLGAGWWADQLVEDLGEL